MNDHDTDPFAHGDRQDGAADLFADIAAYRRLIGAANAASEAGDEGETARLCDQARLHRDKIEQYQPTTLAGLKAAFNFYLDDIGDHEYIPEGAIGILRIDQNRKVHRSGLTAGRADRRASRPPYQGRSYSPLPRYC